MFVKRLMVLALISLLAGWGTASAKTLWFDQFNDGKLDEKNYKYTKGEWIEADGVLKQTDEATGDPTHAIILIPIGPSELFSSTVIAVEF